MLTISYRKLTGYKYQLTEHAGTCVVKTPILPGARIAEPLDDPLIILSVNGELRIKPGYAWDGPSGPTIDTPNFMRASLVHDALYQLMRAGRLSTDCRKIADQVLRRLCREDGMSRLRAWYVYRAVRLFAGGSARRQPETRRQVYWAPRS